MSNPNRISEVVESPAGLIFLFENGSEITLQDIDRQKTEIMLGRGAAASMGPRQQERAYARLEALQRHCLELAGSLGHVAVVGAEM